MRLTVEPHGIEVQSHEIRQKKSVPFSIPRAISYVEGVRRVCAASSGRELRRRGHD